MPKGDCKKHMSCFLAPISMRRVLSHNFFNITLIQLKSIINNSKDCFTPYKKNRNFQNYYTIYKQPSIEYILLSFWRVLSILLAQESKHWVEKLGLESLIRITLTHKDIFFNFLFLFPTPIKRATFLMPWGL